MIPDPMTRGTRATAVYRNTMYGNTVYVTEEYSHHVWAYDLEKNVWTRLPDCPQQNAGLVVIGGLLTAVGGWGA